MSHVQIYAGVMEMGKAYREITISDQHVSAFNRMVVKGYEPDDCWGWSGCVNEHGYGRIRINWHEYKAHRLSFAIHYGEDPAGLDVCHKCDNPTCTNPRHLFVADHQTNMADAVRKGRWENKGRGVSRNAGQSNGQAKLTDTQIAEIRARYARGGVLQRELAIEYSISRPGISEILSGKKRQARYSPDHLRHAAGALEAGSGLAEVPKKRGVR